LLKQKAAEARLYKGTDNAEVSQWLSLSRGLCEGTAKKTDLLAQLDATLVPQSYCLAGASAFSIADVAVFDAVQQPKVAPECVAFPGVCRWAHHMSAVLGVPSSIPLPFVPTVFGITQFVSGPTASASASASSVGDEKAKEGGAEESKGEKTTPPPMSEKQLAKQKEKAAKKEKAGKDKDKKAEAPAPTSDDLDPSKLDFRVGLVVKCWPHPDAEKLLW
jgi:hypothetical protein